MPSTSTDADASRRQALATPAYAAFDRGELTESVPLFERLAAEFPREDYEYMLGLAHKYLRNWALSIHHNLRAIALAEPEDSVEGARWNLAIAASALGEWGLAREHWIACGIQIAPGDAPMDDERGIVAVRLNPWDSGETLFAMRIGLARARLVNIPLPESGHRLGDLVVIDGAKTGERRYGEATVPVFNVLQRLVPSPYRTYSVRVECPSAADAEALEDATAPGVRNVEDWTRSMQFYCKSCSYGLPHAHADREPDDEGWVRERHMGIAAESRDAVDGLLDAWVAEASTGPFLERLARRRPRRAVLEVGEEEQPETAPAQGSKWWVAPDDDEGDGETGAP
jgi:hypothetical protein